MVLIDVTINGHRYTNDPNLALSAGIPPEYQFIGYNAIPALANFVADVQLVGSDMVNAATTAQAVAEAAAASALLSPTTAATSASSLAIGLGTINFVLPAGKDFRKSMFVTLASDSSPDTLFMNGPLSSYDPATGAASAKITRAQGSGTHADWTVTLSAPAQPASGGSVVSINPTAINATSLKYQEMQPSGQNIKYTLTGAGTSIQGAAAFTLRNRAVVFPWDVAVWANTLRGFLRPNKTGYVDVVGANYQPRDLSGFGSAFLLPVTFSGIVAGTGGVWTKAVPLPSGGTMLIVHGAAVHAIGIDAAGATTPPLLLRSGLSTIGGEGTVAAIAANDGTDNVLVVSVPDSGTAWQSVIVGPNGLGGLALGNVASITVGTATARIVDIKSIPDASGGLVFIAGLMSTAGTALTTYGINITTPGANSHTVNAARTDATVGGIAALLVDAGAQNVYMTATLATATSLALKAFAVNGLGAQTAGGTQSVAITSGTAVQIRATNLGDGSPAEFGPWSVGYIVSNAAKIALLTLTGATPALSAGTTVNSAITTVTSMQLGENVNITASSYQSVAVCGTDSAGRFLCEIVDFSLLSSPPATGLSSTVTVAMSAAITAVWIGPGNADANVYLSLWQLNTASEALIAMTPILAGYPTLLRLQNAGGYAALLQAPDPLTIKTSRNRNTLRSSSRCIALGDGSKPSMEYIFESAYGEPTARPVSLIAAPTFGSFGAENYPDSTWIASGPAPMTNLHIQNFKVV